MSKINKSICFFIVFFLGHLVFLNGQSNNSQTVQKKDILSELIKLIETQNIISNETNKIKDIKNSIDKSKTEVGAEIVKLAETQNTISNEMKKIKEAVEKKEEKMLKYWIPACSAIIVCIFSVIGNWLIGNYQRKKIREDRFLDIEVNDGKKVNELIAKVLSILNDPKNSRVMDKNEYVNREHSEYQTQLDLLLNSDPSIEANNLAQSLNKFKNGVDSKIKWIEEIAFYAKKYNEALRGKCQI